TCRAELLRDPGGANHPGIVGELQHLALDRPGDGDPRGGGEWAAETGAEILPGGLQARMFGGLERALLAPGDDASARHLGDCEAGVGAADVDRDDLGQATSSI